MNTTSGESRMYGSALPNILPRRAEPAATNVRPPYCIAFVVSCRAERSASAGR
jgi:hypothetical protein